MAVIEIWFGDNVRTMEDIFQLFEKSDINVEKCQITNWNALDEIIRDAVNYFSMNIILRGLDEANIEKDARRILMEILKLDDACVKGSLTIENP